MVITFFLTNRIRRNRMFKNFARRAGIVISAVALCATALLSPAGAANTAYEHRIDTDDDGVVDSRAFAGRDRYTTATLLADRYVTDHGVVDTVIVASGVSQVDAVAAAALAGTELAPVLLTETDRLTAVTASWVDDNDVLDVIIVGGPAAVSETVEAALSEVGIVESVRRIHGADRYETAALIADETAAGAWCGLSENAAFVVSGTDITAAAIVAPASAAMGVPVLLADSESGLPAATVQRLDDLDVDRIIFVSTDGPQAAVATALADHVSTVETVTGNAATASAQFAELFVTDCADENNVNLEAAALATNPVDALAASLTLSDFAQDDDSTGGIVPVLFTDKQALHGSVGDWLENTPTVIDDRRTHFAVIALGGTAAVPASLVNDAVHVAASSDALTVSIENVDIDNGSFDLLFSENVDPSKVTATTLADVVEINGIPLHGATVTTAAEQPAGADCDTAEIARRFTVSDVSLGAGDTIAVVSSAALFGNKDDQRSLSATTHRVRAERAPSRPTLSIVAIAGQDNFWIDVNKPGDLDLSEIEVDEAADATRGDVEVTATADDAAELGDDGGRITVTLSHALVVGDRVIVPSGAFEADDESLSGRVSRTAVAPDDSFEATRVDVTVEHTAQASGSFGGVTVAAVEGGSADGARGNGWTVQAWDAYGYDAESDTVSVEVVADPRHQIITVKFLSGTPTVADIVDAVNSVSALRGVIEASAGCNDATDKVGYSDSLGGDLTDGTSEIVFSVVFSDHVKGVSGTGLTEALGALIDDGDNTTDEPTGVVGDAGTHPAPDDTVTVTYEITDADRIPDARSVEIPANAVTGYGEDDTNTPDVTEGEQLAETVRVRIR